VERVRRLGKWMTETCLWLIDSLVVD